WYGLVAAVYGAALVFIISFLGSLMVYLSKWGLDRTWFVETAGREPSFLYVYAPTTFGWRDLLLQDSPAFDPQTGQVSEARYQAYLNGETFAGTKDAVKPFGAFLVAVWLALAVLLIVGFAYAYFWTAATQVYLLLRRKVDDTDLDE